MLIVFPAEVVELADTLGSGSSGGNSVGVRIPPSAPIKQVIGNQVIGEEKVLIGCYRLPRHEEERGVFIPLFLVLPET